jgi:hypothetical protein
MCGSQPIETGFLEENPMACLIRSSATVCINKAACLLLQPMAGKATRTCLRKEVLVQAVRFLNTGQEVHNIGRIFRTLRPWKGSIFMCFIHPFSYDALQQGGYKEMPSILADQ